MMIPGTLCAIVWIGCFNPFGETWNPTQLMHYTIIETSYGPLTGNR